MDLLVGIPLSILALAWMSIEWAWDKLVSYWPILLGLWVLWTQAKEIDRAHRRISHLQDEMWRMKNGDLDHY